MKSSAGRIPFFWKKVTKVFPNSVRIVAGVMLLRLTSESGFGRMYLCQRAKPMKLPAKIKKTKLQAKEMRPVVCSK